MPKGIYLHKSLSKEHRRNISKALKKAYQEGRKKIPQNFTHLGHKHSKESKLKISKSHLGKIGYWKGKHRSKETKRKISLGHLGKYQGKNSWNWKGGLKRYKHLGNTLKYRKWRKSVFVRNNYTCQICEIKGNQSGGYLEAHHLKGWTKYPKLRYKINNGITLCKVCHKLYGF